MLCMQRLQRRRKEGGEVQGLEKENIGVLGLRQDGKCSPTLPRQLRLAVDSQLADDALDLSGKTQGLSLLQSEDFSWFEPRQ